MKKLLLITLALVIAAWAFAQTDITIGTGTSTGRYPFNDFYVYSRSQCIYLESEIGYPGTIHKLRWYRSDTGADPNAIGTTQIWLKTVTNAVFTDANWEDPGTLVYEIANIDLGTGGGWYEVDINDFNYTGGNLLVSVYTQNAPYTTPHSYWYYTATTGFNRCRLGNSDTVNPPTLSLSTSRPNIQINMTTSDPTTEPNPAINPSPANASTNIPINVTLSWSSGGGAPTDYKIFLGTSETSFENEYSGITTTSFSPSNLQYSTTYYWKVDPHNNYGYASDIATLPVWSFTTMADPTITEFPHTESFDGITFPPFGWTHQIGSGATGWQRSTGSTDPTVSPYSGAGMLYYNSYSLTSGSNASLFSPPIDAGDANMIYSTSFWMYRYKGYYSYTDKVEIYSNTTPSLTGATLLGTIIRDYDQAPVETGNGWYQYTFEIGPGAENLTYYVIFKAISNWGYNINVDEISFKRVQGGIPPNLAINPSPSNNASSVAITTNLSWSSGGGGPTGYKVYLGTDQGNLIEVADQPETVYDPPENLLFGNTYYWKVDPYNEYGYASEAGEIPVWKFSTVSGIATTPSPSNGSTNQDVTNRVLNWADVTGASGYKVKVGTSSGASDLVNMATVNESQYTHSSNWPYSTTIYWTVFTLNGTQEVQGTEWSFTTIADPTRPIPYLETFDASTSLPANWTGTFSVSSSHGVSSNGLYTNLWSSNTSAYVTTPPVGPLTDNTTLQFDYRYVDYTGYPNTAHTLLAGDKLEIQISTDGTTFTTIHTIDSSNHITSTSFATCTVPITQTKVSQGDIIKAKFLATRGGGDYYLDIDNVYFKHISANPIFSITPASKAFGDVQINTVSSPQVFTIKNDGGGTLIINPAVELTGTNADQFQLTDTNSYPCELEANETMTVSVTFAPNSVGEKSANLTIIDNIRKTVHNISLSGNCYDPTLYPPVLEDFSDTSFPPAYWTRYSGLLSDINSPDDLTPTTFGWTRGSFGNIGSNGSAKLNIYGSTCKYWLITPPIELGSEKTTRYNLSFDLALTDYYSNNPITSDPNGTTGTDDKFAVLITDGETMLEVLRLWDNTSSEYVYNNIPYTGETVTIPINSYSGKVMICFYGESTVGNADNDLFVDNFAISIAGAPPTPPTTSVPTNGAINVAINTSLSWSGTTGEVTGYKIYFGTNADNLTELADVPAPPYIPEPGLLAYNTTYYWRVDPYHSEYGFSTGTVWHFTTMADPTISVFPYTENFEGTFLPNNWSKIVYSPNDITQSSTKNHTPGGQYSARFSSYYSSTNYNQYLFTPPILVTSPYTNLSFWHIKYDSEETLEWGIASNTNPENYTWNSITLSSSQWQETNVNLSDYVGQTIYIGFHYYGNYTYYVYLDDVKISSDIPAGQPIVIQETIVTSTIDLDINETIDVNNLVVVSLPNYDNLTNPIVFGLTGTGTGTITIEVGPGTWYGVIYYSGAWNHGEPYPCVVGSGLTGTITFANVDFGTKGDVIVVVNEGDDPTLPVTLSNFTAVVTSENFVNIAWMAETETNHSGYNIFRNETKDLENAIKINAQLIDKGTAVGTQISYFYTDFEVYTNMMYYYWLESVALDGSSQFYGPLTVTIGDPAQEPLPPVIPMVTKLYNAFPNPFNPNTNIRYSLKEVGKVKIEIYNMKGQKIKTFTQEHNSPGYYQVSWDGRDENGRSVASGIYLYRLTTANYTSAKKMVLAK